MKTREFLIVMVTIVCWSCQSAMDGKEMDIELVVKNLSINGNNDPALLIGEWELFKFAYTANGEKISNERDIADLALLWGDKVLRISYEDPLQYIKDAPPDLFGPFYILNSYHFYSISDNKMTFSKYSDSTFGIDIHITDEGFNVLNALKNTYSFVIQGNELIIYFTGMEDRNLLILKKNKQ